MTLYIIWNTLYASKSSASKKAFAMKRIIAHYERKKLDKRGVEFASVRPTPWHGENGKASTGGHITVDFVTPETETKPVRVRRHHVYPSDEAY